MRKIFLLLLGFVWGALSVFGETEGDSTHIQLMAAEDHGQEELLIEDSASFLQISFLVADPSQQHSQSVFGHAFLRMQCPSADLDYCFTMESGDYEGLLDICIGNYPNRLACIPTAEYIATFLDEGRVVTEYPLLLELEEGQQLWQLLDETVASGLSPYHDYFHHGCSQEIIRLLAQCLHGTLTFGEAARQYDGTLFTLGNRLLPAQSWLHLPSTLLITTDGTDRRLTDMEKTAFPLLVPILLSDAQVTAPDGSRRPILHATTPTRYLPRNPEPEDRRWPIAVWFWAALATTVALTMAERLTENRIVQGMTHILDILLLALYAFITGTMLYICLRSSLPTTSGWNWNYLIYNPLPLLVALYDHCYPLTPSARRHTYLIYALWLLAFLAVMFIVGDHLMLEQYLLAGLFAVRCFAKGTKKNKRSK
ncbi:MAG: DUF4105 domain-containing protein [Bacteroidaceae bacterium]|nr:DUF4105 domain-containing protein [Bacteroidaceae bacterium]